MRRYTRGSLMTAGAAVTVALAQMLLTFLAALPAAGAQTPGTTAA
jgi:hypothetical protein